MCLGMPGQVIEFASSDVAVVDFWGVRRPVRLHELAVRPLIGEYLIDHAGVAVRVIPTEDVHDTLALYEVLLSEAGEDPIVRDASRELECAVAIELEEPALA